MFAVNRQEYDASFTSVSVKFFIIPNELYFQIEEKYFTVSNKDEVQQVLNSLLLAAKNHNSVASKKKKRLKKKAFLAVKINTNKTSL